MTDPNDHSGSSEIIPVRVITGGSIVAIVACGLLVLGAVGIVGCAGMTLMSVIEAPRSVIGLLAMSWVTAIGLVFGIVRRNLGVVGVSVLAATAVVIAGLSSDRVESVLVLDLVLGVSLAMVGVAISLMHAIRPCIDDEAWIARRLADGRCPRCDYDLRGQPADVRCPECGGAFAARAGDDVAP